MPRLSVRTTPRWPWKPPSWCSCNTRPESRRRRRRPRRPRNGRWRKTRPCRWPRRASSRCPSWRPARPRTCARCCWLSPAICGWSCCGWPPGCRRCGTTPGPRAIRACRWPVNRCMCLPPWPTGWVSGRSSGRWRTWPSASWSRRPTRTWPGCWTKSGWSANSMSSRSAWNWLRPCRRKALMPRSRAGPSTSTASSRRCAASRWASTRFSIYGPCAWWFPASRTVTRCFPMCTRVSYPCPRSSTTTLPNPSPMATSRCIPWCAMNRAGRSRSRSVPRPCTITPNMVSPRTGPTRRRAPRATPACRPARSTTPRLPCFGNCSRGNGTSAAVPRGCARTGSMC